MEIENGSRVVPAISMDLCSSLVPSNAGLRVPTNSTDFKHRFYTVYARTDLPGVCAPLLSLVVVLLISVNGCERAATES